MRGGNALWIFFFLFAICLVLEYTRAQLSLLPPERQNGIEKEMRLGKGRKCVSQRRASAHVPLPHLISPSLYSPPYTYPIYVHLPA
ncbi:hypothetical protein F4859DRAFT_496936 [Xylaria cf. heliscus]|nr:hypothetical protein F4859DRAFT_496936 [Xylaria cf. heliscus]